VRRRGPPVRGGEAGLAVEDAVEAGAQLRPATGHRVGTTSFQVGERVGLMREALGSQMRGVRSTTLTDVPPCNPKAKILIRSPPFHGKP